MNSRRLSAADGHRRVGLAPLELVLALPMMLFVMALIVNMGNIGAWKVRAQANTRYAAWRTLRTRAGQYDPNPVSWPSPATLRSSGGSAADSVNAVWNSVPELTTPVVRGPTIFDPLSGLAIQVRRRLEMSSGTHKGQAHIDQKLPLLRGMLANDGQFTFDLDQNLLDNRWEFHNLGFGDNRSRRAKQWYYLDPQYFPNLAGMLGQLQTAHGQLLANPSAADLDPLDRDDEFIYYRQLINGWASGGSAPDFHPRIGGCDSDLESVRSNRLPGLKRRVEKLPGTMARAFIRLYQQVIRYLEGLDPAPPNLDQLIQELQDKIDKMNKFLASLPQQNK